MNLNDGNKQHNNDKTVALNGFSIHCISIYSIVKYIGNKLFEGLCCKIMVSLKPTTCRKASGET